MKQNLLRLLLLVVIPIRPAIALDLTPAVSEYIAEGITFRQLTFQDGKRKAVYEPPRLWSYRGGGSRLQLMPPEVDRADAIIQVVESKMAPGFDEKAIATLKEQSLLSVPPGSQAAALVSEEQNPVNLDNSASYGVTISYKALGETFIRSIVFVNLAESQLTFRLTARQADFGQLQRVFRPTIFSWHWADPTPPKSASQALPQAIATR